MPKKMKPPIDIIVTRALIPANNLEIKARSDEVSRDSCWKDEKRGSWLPFEPFITIQLLHGVDD